MVFLWFIFTSSSNLGSLPFPTELIIKEHSRKMRSFPKSTIFGLQHLRLFQRYKNKLKSLKENKRNQKFPNFLRSQNMREYKKHWYKRILIIHQGMLHNKLTIFIVLKRRNYLKSWIELVRSTPLMTDCIFWDKFVVHLLFSNNQIAR